MARLSVIDPITPAWNRMVDVCFRPFSIGKWFVLGFCAFLAYLGQQSGNVGNVPGPIGPGGGPGGGGGATSVADWILANLGIIIAISAIAILLFAAFIALLLWLQARGKFMFLDGVVRNRAAVREPWRLYRELGNSLFVFSFLVFLAQLLLFVLIVIAATAIAWPDLKQNDLTAAGITGLVVGGILLLLLGIVGLTIGALLENFVMPAMYVRNEQVIDAWRTCNRELFQPHLGPVVLFLLMKLLLGMVVGTVAAFAMCATCCIAALPYIGMVILLPLYVFPRCYSLCFLEQLGPSWAFFTAQDLLRCRSCGYDLRGSQGSMSCPECGSPFREPPPPAAPPTDPGSGFTPI